MINLTNTVSIGLIDATLSLAVTASRHAIGQDSLRSYGERY